MGTEPADDGPPEPAALGRGIGHSYGKGSRALDRVDLRIERAGITALIGANGSGKTTLLRILAGILAPTAGAVEWPGLPAQRGTVEGRRHRGYVAQDPSLDPEMTCGETLTLLAAMYGFAGTARSECLAAVSASFGLAGSWGRRVDALSGGQKRRLHLAGGMLHDPTLLCLDEPTAGLDPDGAEALWAELGERAAQGAAVVVVTHDLAAVERLADTVVILETGRIVAAGEPRQLVSRHPPDLASVYRQSTGREPSALAPRRREPGRAG